MLNCLICPFLRGISKGGLKGKFTLYAFIVTNEVILCLYLLWLIQLFCVCICIPNHAGEWLCWCWGAWRELLDVIHSPNDEGAWGALVLRCMTWVVLWGTYLTMQVRDWRALVLRGSDAEVRGVSGFLGYIPNDAGAWSALMLKCMTWVVPVLGYIPNDASALRDAPLDARSASVALNLHRESNACTPKEYKVSAGRSFVFTASTSPAPSSRSNNLLSSDCWWSSISCVHLALYFQPTLPTYFGSRAMTTAKCWDYKSLIN